MREQRDATRQEVGGREQGPGGHERRAVVEHVVAADVVFDASPQVAGLAPDGRRNGVAKPVRPPLDRGQSGAPGDDPTRGGGRMPGREAGRRVRGQPGRHYLGPKCVAGSGSQPVRILSERAKPVEVKEEQQAAGPVGPEPRGVERAPSTDRAKRAFLVRRWRGAGLRRLTHPDASRTRAPRRRRTRPGHEQAHRDDPAQATG